ncbi:nucleotidyltransferase domain-containing protein [Bacillus gobiensis]
MKINHTIEKLSSILQNHLQSNLAGIYLHGSLAMNCFNPIHSDIDLLVICKSKLTDDSLKRRLIDDMMAFSNIH